MSNIGHHIKKIDDLNLNTYNFHYIDVHEEVEQKKGGSSSELGRYVFKASKTTKQMAERTKNMLKPGKTSNDRNSFSDNYFEATYMPCYSSVGGSALVLPTGRTKYNYVINKKNTNVNNIDNLVQNTDLDINKDNSKYQHMYKFEKEFTIYNEKIQPRSDGKINIGKYVSHSNSKWDNSVYTRINGGNDWHSPPRDKEKILQHEFNVLKTKPPYVWVMYYTNDKNISGKDDNKWVEGWRNRSRWLKFEYKNIPENKVRAWFILNNIREEPGIENLNYELNGLFDGKTYRCKKISMPTRDENGGCSKFMTVSDTDYYFLKNNHRNLFDMCNPNGQLKPFKSGFQNEYVKVKKQIGSGYILVSGLLMLYLLHRLFNRK